MQYIQTGSSCAAVQLPPPDSPEFANDPIIVNRGGNPRRSASVCECVCTPPPSWFLENPHPTPLGASRFRKTNNTRPGTAPHRPAQPATGPTLSFITQSRPGPRTPEVRS